MNNLPFCPGLIVTRLGMSNYGSPVQGVSILQGSRLGRYVTMRTLAVKVQAKLMRSCPTNATVKVHLFLVLDRDPTIKFDADPFQDVSFTIEDKKVDRFSGSTLIDNPQRMMFTLARDTPIQQRFRVLQKKTIYLSRGASDVAPIDTSQTPPYQQAAFGVPPVLATGATAITAAGQTTSLMPTRAQGSSRAPFVGYTTMFLKAKYKFDFGDVPKAGVVYTLPINHQIRLCAYTETTGVALTDSGSTGARSIPVELVYSGQFRFVDP